MNAKIAKRIRAVTKAIASPPIRKKTCDALKNLCRKDKERFLEDLRRYEAQFN